MGLQRNQLANAEKVREWVDSAFACRYHDVAAMLRLSSMAVALVEEKPHEMPVDLVVAAWTQYGNALRISGRYEEAERALEKASALPASDPATKAHLLEIKASFYRNTDRSQLAAEVITAAIDLHRSTGNVHDEVRTWDLLGIICVELKDFPRALRAFQSGLELLGPGTPLDVVASLGHNLVKAMILDGRLSAATSGMTILEPFYRRLTSVRLTAKVEWLRADLCRELRQFPAAQLAYDRAYALLITEPLSPDLPELSELMKEKAAFETLTSKSPGSPEGVSSLSSTPGGECQGEGEEGQDQS